MNQSTDAPVAVEPVAIEQYEITRADFNKIKDVTLTIAIIGVLAKFESFEHYAECFKSLSDQEVVLDDVNFDAIIEKLTEFIDTLSDNYGCDVVTKVKRSFDKYDSIIKSYHGSNMDLFKLCVTFALKIKTILHNYD